MSNTTAAPALKFSFPVESHSSFVRVALIHGLVVSALWTAGDRRVVVAALSEWSDRAAAVAALAPFVSFA